MRHWFFNLLYVLLIFIASSLVSSLIDQGYSTKYSEGNVVGVFFLILGSLLYKPVFRLYQQIKFSESNKLILKPDSDLVLYLRSFSLDGKMKSTEPILDIANIIFFPSILIRDLSNQEQRILQPFTKLGVPVALSAPENPVIPGAKRLYVDDSEWKEEFSRLVQRAKLIVIQQGTSKELLFEIQEIVRHGLLNKTVLVSDDRYNEPKVSAATFNVFVDATKDILPHILAKSSYGAPNYIVFSNDCPTYMLDHKEVTEHFMSS